MLLKWISDTEEHKTLNAENKQQGLSLRQC